MSLPTLARPGKTSVLAPEDDQFCPGVTPRVILFSLALAALFGCLIPILDFKLGNTFLGASHLPPGAVGALLVLILVVNPLLRLVSRRAAFSRNEMLTVYITCLFSCLISGHGGENIIIPNLLAPFYYATPENKWMELLSTLKPWLTPALHANGTYNAPVVEGWFNGLAPGQAIPWAAWVKPLAFWSVFTLVSYGMLGSLSVILRAQWAENEALGFPLLKLPLELTEGADSHALPPIFGQPLLWIGFGVAAFVQGMNGLNLYFPDVPAIQLRLDTAPFLSEAPWNQIGWAAIVFYPIAIGVAYLLTTEVSFSLWFFVVFIALQHMAAYFLGFVPATLPAANAAFTTGKAFAGFQIGGAYLAYVGVVLWLARGHLSHVFRRAMGREKAREGEKNEVLNYPLAFWGFVGGFTFLVAASVAAGVRLDVALVLWVGYLIFAIGLTRAAVEAGMLTLLHQSSFLGGAARMLNSGSSLWLTPATGVVPAGIFSGGFIFHMRGFLMPSFLQSFKLAHDQKIAPRRLGWLLVGVILLSMGLSWWSAIRLGYQNGALGFGNKFWAQGAGFYPISFATAMVQGDQTSASANALWFGVGAVLTVGMMAMRARFLWFPLHPLGYLVSMSYPAKMLWASIFLGWLCKTTITRFGGADSARKATPFFLGLAVGDVAMMLLWLVVDGFTGRAGHSLSPG